MASFISQDPGWTSCSQKQPHMKVGVHTLQRETHHPYSIFALSSHNPRTILTTTLHHYDIILALPSTHPYTVLTQSLHHHCIIPASNLHHQHTCRHVSSHLYTLWPIWAPLIRLIGLAYTFTVLSVSPSLHHSWRTVAKFSLSRNTPS